MTAPAKKAPAFRNARRTGTGPRFFNTQIVALAVLFFLLIFLSLRFIRTLWPGSAWITAWYGPQNHAAAAAVVAASSDQQLTDALQLVARLRDPDAAGLTAAQSAAVNRALATAAEISARAAAAETSLRATATATAAATRQPATLALGTAVPPSIILDEIAAALSQARHHLQQRLALATRPAPEPGTLDLLLGLPPPDLRPLGRSGWHGWLCPSRGPQNPPPPHPLLEPLPSEITAYNAALAASRKDRAPHFQHSSEINYLVLIFFFGMLGACVRTLASLADYVGNSSYRSRWLLYYVCQPWIGGTMAVAFYVLLRGGFMSTENSASNVTNIYACCAFAVLVGISTKEALQKIKNIAIQFFAKSDPSRDTMTDTRSDALIPLIEDVCLDADGTGGVVIGRRLEKAETLCIDKRAMTIVANTSTGITFKVPAGPALTQETLKDVMVTTAAGASAAYTDTTPGNPADTAAG